MIKTVQLVHHYSSPASELFRVATDMECFQKAMEGVATFDPLPEGPLEEGMVINTNVSLFGKLPPMPYTMEIIKFGPKAMIVQSHEYGGQIKSWDHTIEINGDEKQSTITDTIHIDAGWMSFLYVYWAKFVYSRRHKPRLQMLGLTEGATNAS